MKDRLTSPADENKKARITQPAVPHRVARPIASVPLDDPLNQPTVIDASIALATFETAHPGFGALALNIRASSLDELFMAQTSSTVPYLGRIARSHAGIARPLIPAGTEPLWIKRALHVVREGRERQFSDVIVLINGSQLCLLMTMMPFELVLVVGSQIV